MGWLQISIQVLPASLLGVLLTIFGASILGGGVSGLWLSLALIAAVVSYMGTLAFREVRGWNMAFFVAFASFAGVALGNLIAMNGGGSWWVPFGVALMILGLGASLSSLLGRWLGALSFSLQVLFWIYLAGWLLIALLRLPEISMQLWAGAGILIFFGLGSSRFYHLRREQMEAGTHLLSESFALYVLAFNLAIAIQVLISTSNSG